MDERDAWDGDGETRAVDALGCVDEPPAEQEDIVPSGDDPHGGDQPIWRRACHVYLRPQEDADELDRLRFGVVTGRPTSLAAIAHRITQMLEGDGIRSLRITKAKLSAHLRRHVDAAQQARYGIQVSSHTGRPSRGTRGVPVQIVEALPAALDPTTPAGRIHEGLTSLIEAGEVLLEQIELVIDGRIVLGDMTIREAIAAHVHVSSMLRQHYRTLHRIGDPGAALAKFRVEVARAMMNDVIASASGWFGKLAEAMPEGRERAQLRSQVVHHGRSFAASLDEISRRYDGVLAAITDEEGGPA